jgi:RND superfamily putative drug exporter
VTPGLVTRGFARAVVKLRWLVVLSWIAGAAAATYWLPGLDEVGAKPLGGLVPRDAEAFRAAERSAELFPIPIRTEIALVERKQEGLTDADVESVAERAAAILRAEGSHASHAVFALPLVNDQRVVPEAREDLTTAVTWLAFPSGESARQQDEWARALADDSEVAASGGSAGITGSVPARIAEFDAIGDALPLVEAATVGVIAILLALTFRSLVAPLVALVSAGLAYLVALRAIGWVGGTMDIAIPQDVEPLVVVLLLGIVTDYAIFFLAGMRGRLEAGDTRLHAALRSTAAVLPVVVTAGLIVTLGAAALLAGELEFFRAFGPGLAVSAVVGLAVSITLVPALLAILGRAAFWPAVPRPARGDLPEAPAVADAPGGRARRTPMVGLLHSATSKPAAAVIVLLTLAVLLAGASGLRDTNLGFTLVRGLPEDSGPNRAERDAGQGFAPGIVAPTEIVVEDEGVAAKLSETVRLEELIAGGDGVAMVFGPREAPDDVPEGVVFAPDGSAVRYAVVFDAPALGGEAIDDLESLQESMPTLLEEAGLPGARASFAGDTALASETVAGTVGDVGRIGLAALAVNLVLLALFLRSLVAPVVLLLTSVLALAATLGVTTYLFQDLLGHDELTYYVPFAAAVLLVSLGSDYNVFVAGQIAREADRRPLREAVAVAAPQASRAITVAGLILAAGFATLAIVPLRAFHELAFALAVGVLIDAFVVRTLLVPALIALLGRLSWWPGRRAGRARRRAIAADAAEGGPGLPRVPDAPG